MVEETKNGVTWDKAFWPETGTIIDRVLPNDLNDLWDKYEDQASVFVAEALIQSPPSMHVRLATNPLQIECLAWSVGDDVVAITTPLEELIEEACDHAVVSSQAQEEEVTQWLASLEALERTIQDGKKYLSDLLAAYRNRTEREHNGGQK